MDSHFSFYLWVIAAIVVAFFVFKKVTGCLIKSIIILVILGVLGYLFYKYFMGA